MNAYCPDCETELDQSTGICPACRWDPLLAVQQPALLTEREMSLTEKYRGTQYDPHPELAMAGNSGISRGRAFVIMGLVAAAAVYGIVLALIGPF